MYTTVLYKYYSKVLSFKFFREMKKKLNAIPYSCFITPHPPDKKICQFNSNVKLVNGSITEGKKFNKHMNNCAWYSQLT